MSYLVPSPTPIANGGTGATTAQDARTALGITAAYSNRDVQTFSAPTFVQTNITTTAGSTSATVASATGIVSGNYISCPFVVPGTTVTNLVGTTVTLSVAAITTGTTAAFFGDLQTWTKPAGATNGLVRLRLWGGGGGGSGGCTNATSTIRPGGPGGGSGGVLDKWLDLSSLPSTVPVVIGHGGPGGVGATTVNAAGGAANSGGATAFDGYACARGGGNGSTAVGGASPSASGGGGVQGGNGGGATSAGTSSSGIPSSLSSSCTENGSGGGASGGGWTSANVTSGGGVGGLFLHPINYIIGGVAGSTSYNGQSPSGGSGTGLLTTGEPVGASGGGGGACVGQSRSGGAMSAGSSTLTFTGAVAGLTAGASGTIVHCASASFPTGIVRVSSITSNTGSGTCTVVLSGSSSGPISGVSVYFVIASTTHNGGTGGVPGGGGGGGGAGVSEGGVVQCNGGNGGAGGAGAAIIETYWTS